MAEEKEEKLLKESCLTIEDINKYLKCRDLFYGWHISQLKIYDTPKELSEFYFRKKKWTDKDCCCHCVYHEWTLNDRGIPNGEICHSKLKEPQCEYTVRVTRPPQAWCYVEEV